MSSPEFIEELLDLLGKSAPWATDLTQLRGILTSLQIPADRSEFGEMLVQFEELLVCLCDDYRDPQLRIARNLARHLLRLLAQQPQLASRRFEGGPSKTTPLYDAIRFNRPPQGWWRLALRKAALSTLLLAPQELADSERLAQAALNPEFPAPPNLPREPSNSTALSLLGQWLSSQAGYRNAALQRALERAAQRLEASALSPSPAPDPDLIAALQVEPSTTDSDKSPALILGQRAYRLTAGAAAQRRNYHTPRELRLPPPGALAALRNRLRKLTNPMLGTTLEILALLGPLGQALLERRDDVRLEKSGNQRWILRQLPPEPGYTHGLTGPGFCPVRTEITLPLPTRLGVELEKILAQNLGVKNIQQLKSEIHSGRRTGWANGLFFAQIGALHLDALEQSRPDPALLVLLGHQKEARREAVPHYVAVAPDWLQRQFRQAIEQVADRSLGADLLEWGWDELPPAGAEHYYGYSLRADLQSLRALGDVVRNGCGGRVSRGSRSLLRNVYNWRVAQLCVLFLASTGVRPTDSIVPANRDWSVQQQIALVSEKDSLAYCSTRLLPLAPSVCAAATRLKRWQQQVMFARKFSLPEPSADEPCFWLLDADEGCLAPTLSNLKRVLPELAAHWLWPNDVFRHHLRSRGLELGIPAAHLRRLLGHHPPHDGMLMPWSDENPLENLHAHDQTIEQLLNELGY